MTAKLPAHERGRRQALRDIAACAEPRAYYLSRVLEDVDFEIRLTRAGRSRETLECLYAHKGTVATWLRNAAVSGAALAALMIASPAMAGPQCEAVFIRDANSVVPETHSTSGPPSEYSRKGVRIALTGGSPSSDVFCQHGGDCYRVADVKFLGKCKRVNNGTGAEPWYAWVPQ